MIHSYAATQTALREPFPSPVPDTSRTAIVRRLLEERATRGISLLIHEALAHECADYIARFRDLRDAGGRALVARNGFALARVVPVGPLAITVRAPRINDRRVVDGRRQRFRSSILPPNRKPRLGNGARLVTAFLDGWARGDFSAVAHHLTQCEFVHAREIASALTRQRAEDAIDRGSEATYEEVVGVSESISTLFGSDDARGTFLVLLARTPAGHQILDLRVFEEGKPARWDEMLEAARSRGWGVSGVFEPSF